MAIYNEGGRWRSEVSDEERERILAAELASLTEDEQECFQIILQEMNGDAQNTIIEEVSKVEYEREVVDIKDWIEDPYYMGEAARTIFPKLKEDIIELFRGDYQEAIWTGGTGYGKSWIGALCIIRMVYELSCLVSPQESYGLSKSTQIVFPNYSVNELIARAVVFGTVKELLDRSPYFKEVLRPRPTQREIYFPSKNISIVPLSTNKKAALGLTIWGSLLDESNFVRLTPSQQGAMKRWEAVEVDSLYTSLMTRIKSRFMRYGRVPGILIALSSKTSSDAFIERKLIESRTNPKLFCRDYSLYEIRPGFEHSKRFKVLVGRGRVRSKILKEGEDITGLMVGCPDLKVVEVPEDFREEFERNIEESLRDISGIATDSISPFIHSTHKIYECIDEKREHPFTCIEYNTVSSQDGFIWDRLVTPDPQGGYMPIVNPEARRHGHIDLSMLVKKGDATGLAVAHVAGFKSVQRRNREGNIYIEKAPMIYVDFMLRIIPPLGEEGSMGEVRQLIYELTDRGYPIRKITLDKFQSIETIRKFESKGFQSEVLSVDISSDPYHILKEAFYENRISMYRYEPLIEELMTLEWDDRRQKVDHPKHHCFVGDTRIPLLDGTIPTIKELAEKNEYVWVYSVDSVGNIVPGNGKAKQTKNTCDLVDVVLDSGAVERCTPDHLWLLRDGSYRRARDLRPGIDRLMPVKRIWPVSGGYERLSGKNKVYGDKLSTHRMVWEFFNGVLEKGMVIHHKNGIKIDNRPENLEKVSVSAHAFEHTTERHAKDPEYRKRLAEGTKRFNNSERGRMIHSIALSRTSRAVSTEERKRRARECSQFRKDINLEKIIKLRDDSAAETANSAARILGCGRNVVMRVLRENNFKTWEEFLQSDTGENHKVRAIIEVKLDEPVLVYDLEVDTYDNFSLSSGVVVHNSKDLSDALAGVVYTLTMHSVEQPMMMEKGLTREDFGHGGDERWVLNTNAEGGQKNLPVLYKKIETLDMDEPDEDIEAVFSFPIMLG